MVDEDKRAWHAGLSYWRGITDVNSASIGIEIVNPGQEWGYRPFPEEPIAALIPLMHGIVRRHRITRGNTVAPSDIHPARKNGVRKSDGKGKRVYRRVDTGCSRATNK